MWPTTGYQSSMFKGLIELMKQYAFLASDAKTVYVPRHGCHGRLSGCFERFTVAPLSNRIVIPFSFYNENHTPFQTTGKYRKDGVQAGKINGSVLFILIAANRRLSESIWILKYTDLNYYLNIFAEWENLFLVPDLDSVSFFWLEEKTSQRNPMPSQKLTVLTTRGETKKRNDLFHALFSSQGQCRPINALFI